MCYAVLGGDMRFVHLVSMLNESGRQAVGFFQEKAGGARLEQSKLSRYTRIISNWPLKAPFGENEPEQAAVLENISAGSVLLLCGPGFPKKRRWDIQYENLWSDETLLQENAYLTAEGAVASAMQRTSFAMTGQNCMVVGYGRIGRALTDILHNLGANVTVISSSESKRGAVRELGCEAFSMIELEKALSGKQIIFSTPPAMFMDRATLKYVGKNAILIDLASPPYGIDLDAAKEMGLCACRESGLPGRYCPMSAARAIYNSILRWEEAQAHD